MAPARDTNCCTCCFSTLLSLGLTALFLWLTLRTSSPKCTLHSLSLSLPHNNNNHTLSFHLSLSNHNMDKSLKYDPVLLTFAIFLHNSTLSPLANATLAPFYQGRGKTAHKWGSARIHDGAVTNRSVVAARRNNNNNNGRVFVRVEFRTHVKYKIWMMFYVKRQRLVGGANVEVNATTGEKVETKGIRLGDEPPRLGSHAAQARSCSVAFVGLFVTVLVYFS